MKNQTQVKSRTVGAIIVQLIFLLIFVQASPSAWADLSGQWTGTMEAGSRPGTIELTLSRDGAGWSAAVRINWNGADFANPVSALNVTENEVAFTTEIAGARARFTGKLVEQKITGAIEATINGRVAGTGTWSVTRNALAPATFTTATATKADSTPNRMIGEVLAIDPSLGQLTLKLDTGETVIVKLSSRTAYLRVPPGEKTLEKAAKITLEVVGIGDRVFANGQNAEDRKSIAAQQLIVMAKAELAQQQERERAEWIKRSIAGTITALNPAAQEITLLMRSSTGDKSIIVTVGAGVRFRRYTPDSVKFSDARPGSFTEIRVGDQLRALGEKGADGRRFTAEEIVSGMFRTIGGVIVAVNTQTKEVKVHDLQTQQPLTVIINQDSLLRRLPPELVTRMRKKNRTPEERPAGEPDLQETLERLPALTVADLKPGDRVIVSSTVGAQPGRVTAIGIFTGVDALLKVWQEQQAAQRGGVNLSLGLPGSALEGLGRP